MFDTISGVTIMNENGSNNERMTGCVSSTLCANRYRIVRQLGLGTTGSVWLAEDIRRENRPVVINLLPSVLLSDRRACQRLKAKVLVLSKLSHPNIVTVRAFEENEGNPFWVVDYIEGQTLEDYLAEKGTLTEDETIRLLKPIAEALDYAHGEGVVHRDVKPGNVVIDKDGTPYILGFISRALRETVTCLTGRRSFWARRYMSSERLRGDAPTSEQDIRSFCAMVYECLTGRPPFSRGQSEGQIEHDDPAPLGTQFAKIGPAVMAGLAKRGEGRLRRRSVVAACVAAAALVLGGIVWWATRLAFFNGLWFDFANGGGVQLWKNGPYWAECNVGAAKPEEPGYCFWWGDTVGSRRNLGNYGWLSVEDGSEFLFEEENCPIYGWNDSRLRAKNYIDETGNLAAAHDAATVHLGTPWRMPTHVEFKALVENCTSEWTQRNGVFGRLVSGKGDFASRSIFLPAVGSAGGSAFSVGTEGEYWSSTPDWSDGGRYLYFDSDDIKDYSCYDDRFYGRFVRPVRGVAQ